MKATKWVTHKLSASEKKAQAIWRRSTSQHTAIVEALMSCDHCMTRDAMHKRLDRRLDAIERQQDTARKLFPEVAQSFTMYTDTITISK